MRKASMRESEPVLASPPMAVGPVLMLVTLLTLARDARPDDIASEFPTSGVSVSYVDRNGSRKAYAVPPQPSGFSCHVLSSYNFINDLLANDAKKLTSMSPALFAQHFFRSRQWTTAEWKKLSRAEKVRLSRENERWEFRDPFVRLFTPAELKATRAAVIRKLTAEKTRLEKIMMDHNRRLESDAGLKENLVLLSKKVEDIRRGPGVVFPGALAEPKTIARIGQSLGLSLGGSGGYGVVEILASQSFDAMTIQEHCLPEIQAVIDMRNRGFKLSNDELRILLEYPTPPAGKAIGDVKTDIAKKRATLALVKRIADHHAYQNELESRRPQLHAAPGHGETPSHAKGERKSAKLPFYLANKLLVIAEKLLSHVKDDLEARGLRRDLATMAARSSVAVSRGPAGLSGAPRGGSGDPLSRWQQRNLRLKAYFEGRGPLPGGNGRPGGARANRNSQRSR